MGQRTIDEVEAAGAELGSRMPRVGFYSYGEISPHARSGVCQLHNQTMTVTAITEALPRPVHKLFARQLAKATHGLRRRSISTRSASW